MITRDQRVELLSKLVRRIHQRWLNQRSQRRSYTWAAYNELMRLLQLEQPRIVPLAKRSF